MHGRQPHFATNWMRIRVPLQVGVSTDLVGGRFWVGSKLAKEGKQLAVWAANCLDILTDPQ